MAVTTRKSVMKWPKNEHRIIEVLWEDSVSTHGWQAEHDLSRTPSLITSVGYVIRDDAVGVVVVQGIDHSETPPTHSHSNYGCCLVIPRSAVREVRVLRG